MESLPIMIRKMIFQDRNQQAVRYDLMIDGVQEHINDCTDEQAIAYFKSFSGDKTQMAHSQVFADYTKQSYI